MHISTAILQLETHAIILKLEAHAIFIRFEATRPFSPIL